jgi:hypothetical protein
MLLNIGYYERREAKGTRPIVGLPLFHLLVTPQGRNVRRSKRDSDTQFHVIENVMLRPCHNDNNKLGMKRTFTVLYEVFLIKQPRKCILAVSIMLAVMDMHPAGDIMRKAALAVCTNARMSGNRQIFHRLF